jgi:hypothetical protein
MCEAIKEHMLIAVQELALKKEWLQEQMLLKKAQDETQLNMKEGKHQLELQHKKQQLQTLIASWPVFATIFSA